METARSVIDVRAADTDRDACFEQLREHFVAGRLSWELDDRIGQALQARNQSDLDDLLADCRPSPSQEQLNEDADRAIAAAEQLRALADESPDSDLRSLLDDANAAEEQARALKEPERQARDAATDASRTVIRANRALNR